MTQKKTTDNPDDKEVSAAKKAKAPAKKKTAAEKPAAKKPAAVKKAPAKKKAGEEEEDNLSSFIPEPEVFILRKASTIAEEEDAKRKAEEDAVRKAEEDAQRKIEEEARQKAEAEAAAKRQAEEQRVKAEADVKAKADAGRKAAEEETRRKTEEAERRKAKADTDARIKKVLDARPAHGPAPQGGDRRPPLPSTMARFRPSNQNQKQKYNKAKQERIAARMEAETQATEVDKKVIKITGQATVRELAEKMEVKINEFISKLMGMGVFATINQRLDNELAELVASEFGFELKVDSLFSEEAVVAVTEESEDKPEDLQHRPPVVTIMGHVDHGKTKLLDAIRSSNVCEGEAGAITQHIGAYKVNTPKGEIVFLDTPGHEAFTAMRARGAQATDIVVLVVSAVDSVMQQTIEAIDHAKAAGAPIIVAVNKIDLPEANPDKVKQDLANHGLIPEEWQGKTIYVEISAKKRLHIDKLLEMIALQAEMMDLKANYDRKGVGIILESKRDSKRGVVATVLNQKGVMRVGDPFVVSAAYGKIRAMTDERGVRYDEIPPSTPVEILGINGEPPAVGDVVHIVASEKDARQIADKRRLIQREENLAHRKHVSLLSLRDQVDNQSLKSLNIIIKGDVQGSIQAIRDSLERLSTDEVEVRIIHSGAGNVNESDILLAKASNAIIFTFHVETDSAAAAEAERSGIEVRNYEIIFELLEDVRAAMEGMLEPDVVEEVVGVAEVRQKFALSSGIIAGSIIKSGTITRGNEVHVTRGKDVVLNSKISGLKRFKEDVREVKLGFECGILIDGYTAIEPGDVVTAFVKKTVTRRLKANDR